MNMEFFLIEEIMNAMKTFYLNLTKLAELYTRNTSK